MSEISPRNEKLLAAIRPLWGVGLSISDIGRGLGVSRGVVIGIAWRAHLPARGSPIGTGWRRPPAAIEDAAIRLRTEGFSYRAIAQQVGAMCHETARRICMRRQLEAA